MKSKLKSKERIEEAIRKRLGRPRRPKPKRRRPKVPKKFGWVKFLKKLEKKGYDLDYYYDGEKKENLHYWTFDLQKGGAEPRVPDRVVVSKVKKCGNDYRKKKIAEIRRANLLQDPNYEQTIALWELIH